MGSIVRLDSNAVPLLRSITAHADDGINNSLCFIGWHIALEKYSPIHLNSADDPCPQSALTIVDCNFSPHQYRRSAHHNQIVNWTDDNAGESRVR